MRKYLDTGATAILVTCALLVTGLAVRHEFFTDSGARQSSSTVADWKTYADAGREMGTPIAPVTVVVFSDFQCPACAHLAQELREFRRKHPGTISVKFRHFPIPGHPYAKLASLASECAAR
jgi:protein-disulfide isomerase